MFNYDAYEAFILTAGHDFMVQVTLLVAFLLLTLRKLKWSLFLVRELCSGLLYIFLPLYCVNCWALSLVLANLFLDQLAFNNTSITGISSLYDTNKINNINLFKWHWSELMPFSKNKQKLIEERILQKTEKTVNRFCATIGVKLYQ